MRKHRPTLTAIVAAAALSAYPVQAIAAGESPETARITHQFVERARKIMMTDPSEARNMGHQMERIMATRPGGASRDLGMSRAKWILGEAALRLNQIATARTFILEAYRFARNADDAQAQGDTLLTRGSIKSETGDPAGALTDYLAAYRMFQKSGDRRNQSITLQYLSALHADAADYQRALNYLRQASEVFHGESRLDLSLSNNTANILDQLGHLDEAETEYRRAASMARKVGEYALQVQVLTNMCRSQITRRHLPAAAATLLEMKNIVHRRRMRIDDKILVTVAQYEEARGNYPAARTAIEHALSYTGGSQMIQRYREMHLTAYRIYRHLGDDRSALIHLEKAKQLRDEAIDLSLSMKTALLSAQFDYANQELRISHLRAQDLRRSVGDARETARLQRTVFTGIVIATLLLIVILSMGVVLLRRSRDNTRRINGELAEANEALEKAMTEVQQRQIAERAANDLAEHDALTGLNNRRHLHQTLYAQVTTASAAGSSCCVMLLDLDRFKPINDIHGHEVGDAVLIEAARRLANICARHDAIPVRLGGDEFVILMTCTAAQDKATTIATEVIAEISAPYDVADRRLTIGTSIGISNDARDGRDIDTLLRAADIAMYEAKRSGRGRYRFFDEEMAVRLRNRAETETELRAVLRNDEILAHFQPIHNYREGRVTGFEALARWTHAERGPIGPDEFIPIAEETGMIEEITTVILRQSCRAAVQWPSDITVSVNMSPILLKDATLASRVFDILNEEGLAPNRLVIEITENAVIDDLPFASRLIDTFKAAGIRVALDDFGKGYSSLSHLRELGFDHLKLDASFVKNLGEGDSIKIATAVAGLAHAMDLPVTAEGVETAEASSMLRQLGFSYAQGYLYGKAMTADEATILILDEDLDFVHKAA